MDEAELKKFIRECIKVETQEAFKGVNTKLGTILDTINTGFDLLNDDRKDAGLIKTSLARTEQFLKELLDIYPRQTKEITQKVADKNDEAVKVMGDKVAEKVVPKIEDAMDNFKKGKPRLTEPTGVKTMPKKIIKFIFRR